MGSPPARRTRSPGLGPGGSRPHPVRRRAPRFAGRAEPRSWSSARRAWPGRTRWPPARPSPDPVLRGDLHHVGGQHGRSRRRAPAPSIAAEAARGHPPISRESSASATVAAVRRRRPSRESGPCPGSARPAGRAGDHELRARPVRVVAQATTSTPAAYRRERHDEHQRPAPGDRPKDTGVGWAPGGCHLPSVAVAVRPGPSTVPAIP